VSTTAAVQADQVTRRFGDFTAVNAISFEVHAGEIFGFLGPNGSGKTTTIRMILGLLQPTAGRITVFGQEVASRGDAASIRRRVGYMSQRFSLYPELTVAENLRFFARAYGVTGERFRLRQAEILRMAGLEGRQDQPTGTLAGGWKQRLACMSLRSCSWTSPRREWTPSPAVPSGTFSMIWRQKALPFS
jgi:ABC-2 type transport system ATP-binding protein